MRITAHHSDPQVAGPAIIALSELGFTGIRVDADDAQKPRPVIEMESPNFDTIIVPAGKSGVDGCFYGENHWRWVNVHKNLINSVKYVAIYETKLDAKEQHARGGRGLLIAYAPVLGYTRRVDNKVDFEFGEIVTLDEPIRSGGLMLRNLRYCKLEKLLKAKTLADLFRKNRLPGTSRLRRRAALARRHGVAL